MYESRVSIPSRQGRFEQVLARREFVDQGLRGDNSYTAIILAVAWTSFLADSPIDSLKPNRVIHKFLRSLCTDIRLVIKTYSALTDDIINYYHSDEGNTFSDVFVSEMKDTPIFREYLHFYKTRDPQTLQYILSFLNFGKKLYMEDSNLQDVAFRKWLEVEESLLHLQLPSFISNLRQVMTAIFDDWNADVFLPKHGSGAVAERGVRGVEKKNRTFGHRSTIDYLYCRDNLFLSDETQVGPLPSPSARNQMPPSRCVSRLTFVPKNYKTMRSICMEPLVYQWAQQGVRLWYEKIFDTGILKDNVFLKDQGVNQRAAQYGSRTKLCDTIDLSSASDSVSWKLVKNIFPAKVLKHLLATRTKEVELPTGDIFSMEKYAPMGSALCFPVQTSLYASIIIMIGIAERWGIDWREPGSFDNINIKVAYKATFNTNFNQKTQRYTPFYVYGDDIVCDNKLTSNIVEALTRLGFKVNEEKSFTGSQSYRESCGKHFFDGVDVTPYSFKTKKVSRRINIESTASFIDACNRAFEYGYLHLRRHLIQFILNYPIEGYKNKGKLNPILFSDREEQSFSIFTYNPINTHLKKINFKVSDDKLGEEPNYQRVEYRSIVPGPRSKRRLSRKFDNYRYISWWRSQYHREECMLFEHTPMTADTFGVGVRWRETSI